MINLFINIVEPSVNCIFEIIVDWGIWNVVSYVKAEKKSFCTRTVYELDQETEMGNVLIENNHLRSLNKKI